MSFIHAFFAVALAALVHELGHVVSALLLGVKICTFSLSPMGGVLAFDFSRTSYAKEVLVHLSGSVMGAVFASASHILFGSRADLFINVSLSFSVLNLLPLIGLDGGGALLAFMSCFLFPDTAYRVFHSVSTVFIIVIWFAVVCYEVKFGANIGLIVFILALGMHR